MTGQNCTSLHWIPYILDRRQLTLAHQATFQIGRKFRFPWQPAKNGWLEIGLYFPNWPPLWLRWAHYFRMRDHGSSLFSAVKNLHFSLLQPHDRFFFFFFFLSCMHVLPSRICRADKKNDTARCHWQQEVNVIRRPLPRKTGRSSECLHASSWSKCMRDSTKHVGNSCYSMPVCKHVPVTLELHT